MADFSALKTSIQNYIKQNGNEEITGNLLQQILLSMVTTLGDSAINDLVTSLNAEIANRGNADTTLQGNIDNEATARGNADTELGGRITTLQGVVNGIVANVENGYVYAGIATPSATPVSGKVFYLALTAGTYTNFGATVVPQGINILKYNGSAWSLDSFLGLDDAPTQGSGHLVKSGGVLDSIIKDGSAFDLSAYNNGTTYADLSAALTALNALPAVYKKGGMSVKYVQTYDNKYVQWRLMADDWSIDVTKWQGVDDEPTAGSKNLIESGGILKSMTKLFSSTTLLDKNSNVVELSDITTANGVYIEENGELRYNAVYAITAFVYIEGSSTLKWHGYLPIGSTGVAAIAFYDENRTFISSVSVGQTGDYTTPQTDIDVSNIPSNAVYIRCSTHSSADIFYIWSNIFGVDLLRHYVETALNTEITNRQNEIISTISPYKINLSIESGFYSIQDNTIVHVDHATTECTVVTINEFGIYTIRCANNAARQTIIENEDGSYTLLPQSDGFVLHEITVELFAGQKLYISSSVKGMSLYKINALTGLDDLMDAKLSDYEASLNNNTEFIKVYKESNFIEDYYYEIVNNKVVKTHFNDWKCISILLRADSEVHLNLNGVTSNHAKAYILSDLDMNVISYSESGVAYNDFVITIDKDSILFVDQPKSVSNYNIIAKSIAISPIINSSAIQTNGNYYGSSDKQWIADDRYTRYTPMKLRRGDIVNYNISLTNATIPFFFKVDDYNNIQSIILTSDGTNSSYHSSYTVIEDGLYVFAIYNGSFSVEYSRYEIRDVSYTIPSPSEEKVELITDGGSLSIFENIGVVGDSLASGVLAYGGATGEQLVLYKELYYYSWPQFIKRKIGNTVFNFSTAGLSAETFFTTNNSYVRQFDTQHCQCYFIALGHNDYNWCVRNWESQGYSSLEECITAYVGTESDIDMSDYSLNSNTYYGNYGKIIQQIKEKVPNAKIFPVVMKSNSRYGAFNTAIKRMAHLFTNIYIVDMAKWFPSINSWEYTEGHGNANGYYTYSKEILSVVDYIIKHNPNYFKYTALIDTDAANYIPSIESTSVPSD